MAALFGACGGDTAQDKLQPEDDAAQALRDQRLEITRKIFYSIPSPMETVALLKKAGAEYDRKLLNDINNTSRYTTNSKRALNLGVYGADLSYASVFNQTQESMLYTSVAKKLADQLDVSAAFSDSTLEAMERNMQDRDALLDIISETYWEMDRYLKEEGRDNISALMIAGGWVEGLYIATQVASGKDTPELRQRIAEQKISLEQLTGLLDAYDQDDAALNAVREDLRALTALFADVELPAAGATQVQPDGTLLVGGETRSATVTDTQLAAIRDKAAAIRNAYIN
jgi:hypothetical protein